MAILYRPHRHSLNFVEKTTYDSTSQKNLHSRERNQDREDIRDMPEIAEVALVVHQIRKRLVGKTIRAVVAKDDANIFGKVGTTAAEFQNAMKEKKIIDAGQQGKYFWYNPFIFGVPLLFGTHYL
ncbi:putative atfpg-1 atfpg-2 atmmh-1 atmmh-2 fpg-1 fpg-2 [Erysiphe necator]|uniref:Putative atfpg-1 atfpg-2 atmmh-1 atmmh-2 fpg-1 fpg-2 n=1 Tax=Uncinula necator TaxID=52586 RepID=A0A0B1P7H6_UNCNE|nr:putative atfpg-1 atfpg-2 atmmh-1 atmmh-2 fpg-1 fpg-2 [Erysiphe necator]